MSFLPSLQGNTNLIAELIGLNEWQLQEASYNGVLFTWMNPSYGSVDPLASLIDYVESSNGINESNAKPNYQTTAFGYSATDTLSRKLATFSPPNYLGDYVEDYNVSGIPIEMVGIIVGPSYQQVLDKCLTVFNDVETSPGSGIGVISQGNFRVLNHVLYGRITDVYLQSMVVLTSDDNYQAASFKITFLATDPSFMVNPIPPPDTWKTEAQNILNNAQGVISSIVQTFTLGQSLIKTTVGLTLSPTPGAIVNSILRIVNGKSYSLVAVENQIQTQLNSLANSFTSSMAFLVQNDGGVVTSPYWESILVDSTLMPVYLAPGTSFSESDAQVIITAYTDQVNNFIAYCESNNFTYNLQNNIFSAVNSITYMDQFVKSILTQQFKNILITTTSVTDLLSLMIGNKVNLNTLETISETNQGLWYSCLTIPVGTTVDLS